MNEVRIRTKIIYYVYIYVFLIMILISSDSIYGIFYNILTPLKIIVIVMGIISTIFLVKVLDEKIRLLIPVKHIIGWLLFITTFLYISFINKSELFDSFLVIIRLFCIYPIMLSAKRYRVDIYEFYAKLIVIIAFVYSVLFIAVNLFDMFSYSLIRLNNLSIYRNYYGLYFQINDIVPFFGLLTMRSNGFTWEPGQYQIYLNVALFYYLFLCKENEKIKKVILVSSIVLTFSTMGLLILMLQFIGYLLVKKATNLTIWIKILIVPVIVIVSLITLNEKTQSGSYMARVDDLSISINAITNNFMYGMGLRKFETSNGLLSLIADYGILAISGLVFAFICFYKNQKKDKNNVLVFFVFFAIIFLGLMNEPIQYTSFIFLIYNFLIFYKHD